MQQNLKFSEDKFVHEQDSRKSQIRINKILFHPKDYSDCANRLTRTTVKVTFSSLGKDGKERKSSSSVLSILAYISPRHAQAVFEINKVFVSEGTQDISHDPETDFLRIRIEVRDLSFLPGERLDILFSR